jgi:hypothetical protein
MRSAPAALGNVVPLGANLPEGSPPTSYAAHEALKGTPQAIASFGGLTLLRSLLIAPGLALMGVRGKQLLYGSLAASGFISISALFYVFALNKKKAQEAARSSAAAANSQAATQAAATPSASTVDTTAEPA